LSNTKETAVSVMVTETLRVTRDDHIAEITLCRPELMNRADEVLHRDLPGALSKIRQEEGLRVVIVAAEGDVFSAGGDFDYISRMHDDLPFLLRSIEEGRQTVAELTSFPLPLIAAVQGDAVGWGASFVFACDAVVAARTVKFADPHVRVGLVAGDGGCLHWPLSLGMIKSRRLLLTGDPLPAEEAHTMGVVTDLVDTPQDVLPAARRIAAKIASLPPLAVQGTKRVLNVALQARANEVYEVGVAQEGITARSDDVLEAIAAAKGRRIGSYGAR
jgi:enoyl-CoA hydratase